jgi:hypothetical protein
MKRVVAILMLCGFLIPFAYGEVIYWARMGTGYFSGGLQGRNDWCKHKINEAFLAELYSHMVKQGGLKT